MINKNFLNLKYVGEKTSYEVNFKKVNPHVVQVTGEFLVKSKGFILFRDGVEDDAWDYSGYTTVYREIEGGVQFSDDGSVYTAPVPIVTFTEGIGGTINGEKSQNVERYEDLIVPLPVPGENYEFAGWEPEIPAAGVIDDNVTFRAIFSYVETLEQVKFAKLQEITAACEQVIYAGVDVALPAGTEHFSLTEKDQINLFGKQAQMAAGAEKFEYHQDGHPCRYYSAREMQMIIESALGFVTYQTTYCNALNMWVRAVETTEEVEAITYGCIIPEEYQSEVLRDIYAARQEV